MFEACNGNPLEASRLTKGFKFSKEDSAEHAKDFSRYLLKKIEIESLRIEDKIKKVFLLKNNENEVDEFSQILPYLNAQIKIHKAKVYPDVLEFMEKQEMVVIHPKTNYLETLTPSAAEAFRLLTKLGKIEIALRTLLYSEGPDAIGRMLEFYIIGCLDNNQHKLREITFSYSDDKAVIHENGFSMNFANILHIPFGQIDPPSTTHSTLYIPKSFTYSCIDLAFYDNHKKILYVMQITINLKSHKEESHDDFLNKYSERWKRVLGPDLQIQFIWRGRESYT